MSILITADWQAAITNLSTCEAAAEKITHLCREHSIEQVCFAGDLKAAYNPVDCRIVKFWMSFISSLSPEVVVVLGNHDRLGLYSDEQNWLPILKRAGANVSWWPERDGNLITLPYAGTASRWKQSLETLDSLNVTKKDILIFHQQLAGAKASKHGFLLDGVPLADIRPDRFRYCIGGHVHLSQQVAKNTYYVGSPFSTDWGEANQSKFFALINGRGLQWIPTGIPGWYDPEVKGFKAPQSWEGAKVRIFVPIGRDDQYGTKLQQAKRKADSAYPGASITVLPRFEEASEHDVTVDAKLSDRDQIAQYIRETQPGLKAWEQEDLLICVEHKVLRTGKGLRADTGVRFLGARAENFLSFEKLDLDFSKPGVVLVTGRNKDWDGRSNGSGKTNLLSVLPVALFGKTFKGQNADAWSQQGNESRSSAIVEFQTADKRRVRVERTRKPATVRLFVNDQEISAGSKQINVGADVERFVGFSWDTFSMAIYLDQEEIGFFLWGTPKQREETLARLQNLERFAAALEIVKTDIKKTFEWRMELVSSLETVIDRLSRLQTAETEASIAKIQAALGRAQKELGAIVLVDPKPFQVRHEDERKKFVEQSSAVNSIDQQIEALKYQSANFRRTPNKCPTCGQSVDNSKSLAKAAELEKVAAELCGEQKEAKEALEQRRRTLKYAADLLNEQMETYGKQRGAREQIKTRVREFDSILVEWKEKRAAQIADSKEMKLARRELQAAIDILDKEIGFLRIVGSVLARTGLPAYLSRLICPKLNKAAAYFSDLFTEGELQVQFSSQDTGGVDVSVINVHGGRLIGDQSTGEKRLAALITSFAIREVASRSNVLVLDEPGDGLDPVNARTFATGIRELKDRFGVVYCMTHNANIEAELGAERQIIVEKENGVSRICS